jgi:carotenoid 1,2-hydratase
VDPAERGAYEWWYFDALSDDGRWAVVAIFFLGAPMSPYYKAAATGAPLDPRDWCGVFVSVHEKRRERWRERAYAYNLYRGGEFAAARPEVAVGGSRMVGSGGAAAPFGGGSCWHLDIDEPGLWRGRTRMRLSFAAPPMPPPPPGSPPLADNPSASDHTWVCVAPHCRVEGHVTLPGRHDTVAFTGAGYHDHNFGRLPYRDTDLWYWGRAAFYADGGGADVAARGTALFYHWEPPPGEPARSVIVLAEPGLSVTACEAVLREVGPPIRGAYGLRHRTRLRFEGADGRVRLDLALRPEAGAFSEGPFYRRLPLTLSVSRTGARGWTGTAEGIGEVFRPDGLCGPIASRAMWSRIRRRRGSGTAGLDAGGGHAP